MLYKARVVYHFPPNKDNICRIPLAINLLDFFHLNSYDPNGKNR